MTVHLSFLLIITGLTGIHSITTVSEVSVKAGDSVTIPCLYDSKYTNHVKYLCKGSTWSSCSYAVKTNQQNSEKFSISDDKKQRIFTVTIKDLTDKDTDYWCAVEINGGSDVREYFHLSVNRDTPSLYVDHQEITGFKGHTITINCHYHNYGEMKWCRLGSSCMTTSSGSIDGTRVTINANVPNVFTVTMSGLRTESSGWYWCVKGDIQMPVHVTVTEKPATITATGLTPVSPTLKPVNLTPAPTAQGGHPSLSDHLKIFGIRLSVLVLVVMVTLFICFLIKRHSKYMVN
ncbi:polymeric immunoglobulin receptor-like [Sebastes fasciatus]|uniref:polymeric immunoglobulin receptor-like n=1 Tax=Sebastes fasciatus TaxID=394691 RepID=UPI003D9E6038